MNLPEQKEVYTPRDEKMPQIGKVYRTPFEPSGLFRVMGIEPACKSFKATAYGVFVGDHPHGYKDNSFGRYFAHELREVEEL